MAKFIKFKQKWGYFMLFVNKLKVLTLMTCLVLVGQGFAQESSQYSAPGSSQSSAPESSSSSKKDFWSYYTSEPGTQTIGGKTYYSITSAQELAWFAAKVNVTEKGDLDKKPDAAAANISSGVNAILMDDIDLSDYLWVPIAAGKGDGIFSGVFDGNNHKITGLRIDGHRIAYETENIYCRDHDGKPLCNGQNIGFFGSSKGTIKNLSLEVADIQASNSEGLTMQMGKPISVGTLVGWMNGGSIDGVYVGGHINTSGNGQGVGGIVGNAASGTIKNSVSDVSIYASGNNVFIGGVAGYTKGAVNINSCMYTGENIVNDGQNGAVGGIVGNSTNDKLKATSSYYDTDMFGEGVGTGSVKDENKPTGVTELNTEQVACGMNGGKWNVTTQVCSEEKTDVWDVGISELSQNGSDGYKITFVMNGNGAVFPDGAVTTKLVAKNAPITADGISLPTREGFKFAGWAETSNAEDPSTNLGTATGRRTIYAVWYGKFPVTFNAGTGSFPNGTPDPLMVAKGDLVSLDIEIPEKASEGEDHFYFAGWTTGTTSEVIFDKNQDITGLVDFDEFTVAAATTFYPAWTKEIVHTVKFNANGHGQTKLEQVDISDGLVLNAPDNPSPYKGYQYGAWCLTQDCQNSSDVFTFPQTINSSFELFAKWSAVPYTINYNLDGGSVPNPGNPSTYTIEDQFVLVDPSRTCYDFIEWYDSEGNHVEGITKGTTEAKTFSARWKQQTKAINYSTGNVIQATARSHEFLCGETITLSDTINAFSRPGYTQDGWTTTIGGSDVLAPKSSYTGTANVALYAHWSLNSYEIIYHLNGGEFATSAISSYTTEDAVVLAEPTRSGYEFQGWYDNTQFEGVAVTEIPLESTGDKNFYAKWSDPIEYTATYDLAGGSMEGDESFTFTIVSGELALATPNERVGFSFAGWLDGVTGDVVTALPAGSIGNRTLTAQWSLLPITVTASSGTFEYDGETHNATCSYEGTLPTDYSIDMVPSGSVQKVSDGVVSTSCTVVIKDESDNVVTDQFTELTIVDGTISVVAKVVPYGAVTIYTDETGNRAVIDGTSSETVNITDEDKVVVNAVTFNRTFPVNAEGENKLSTLTLPFSIEKSKVSGAEFYELNDVVGTKVRIWKSLDVLEANTPYIIRTTADHLTFTLDEGDKLTLNTEKMNNSKSSDGLWEIRGVYEYKQWTEGDKELGLAYGYTAKATNNLSVGKFAKNGIGAYIKPLRAYLLKTPEKQAQKARRMLAKSIASISDDTDSDELDVEIVDRETGETTIIGKLNKATGEIKIIDNWYDMKGRRLNAKPTTKGIYYFNGKRVMVK